VHGIKSDDVLFYKFWRYCVQRATRTFWNGNNKHRCLKIGGTYRAQALIVDSELRGQYE